MKQYRVTKYDPIFRDENGVYTKDEWTDFSDIGKTFSGVVLTAEEYERVESNYIRMCVEVWERQGRPTLHLKDVEKKSFCFLLSRTIKDSAHLSAIIRKILRNQLWARVVGQDFFLHFGYDCYMYIGTLLEASTIEKLASAHDLFSEERESPYLETES